MERPCSPATRSAMTEGLRSGSVRTAGPAGLRGRGVALALAARGNRLAPARRELDLAQADALRRHLDALVLADELEGLLERERPGRDQAHELVGGGGADVRQLLLLAGVHVEVVVAGVLSNDHPLVELRARADEERAALLEGGDRERRRLAA